MSAAKRMLLKHNTKRKERIIQYMVLLPIYMFITVYTINGYKIPHYKNRLIRTMHRSAAVAILRP